MTRGSATGSKRSATKRKQSEKLIREKIERSCEAGPRREALLFRALYGAERIPLPRDFMEACLWLDDKRTGVPIQWKLNRPQRILDYLIWRAERDKVMFRAITLKARQWGISTYFVGKGIERCARHDHARAAIVADKDETSAALLERGKVMLRSLPHDLPMRRNNKSELELDDPFFSRLIISSAMRQNPLRGQTCQFAHCTELPFWKDPRKKLRGINQAVPKRPGTLLSHEYTANGIANIGYDFFWDAKKGKNEYLALFFPWYMDANFDYSMECRAGEMEEILSSLDEEEMVLVRAGVTPEQLKWRRNTIRNECFGDIDSFHQEYPSNPAEAFLASGRPAFVTKYVMAQMARCSEPTWRGSIDGTRENIRLIESDRGELSIWEKPRDDRNYVISADTGHGLEGGDNSTLVVLEILSGKVAATYASVCGPEVLGKDMALLGWLYNEAYAMPEITGVGRATLTKLRDMGYEHIGWQPTLDVPGDPRRKRYGWSTDVASKPNLVLEGRELLQLGPDCPEINDERIMQEASSYVIDEAGRFNAQLGHHDDLLMAWLIACIARRDVITNGIVDVKGAKRASERLEDRHWAEWHALTDENHEHEEEDDDGFDGGPWIDDWD